MVSSKTSFPALGLRAEQAGKPVSPSRCRTRSAVIAGSRLRSPLGVPPEPPPVGREQSAGAPGTRPARMVRAPSSSPLLENGCGPEAGGVTVTGCDRQAAPAGGRRPILALAGTRVAPPAHPPGNQGGRPRAVSNANRRRHYAASPRSDGGSASRRVRRATPGEAGRGLPAPFHAGRRNRPAGRQGSDAAQGFAPGCTRFRPSGPAAAPYGACGERGRLRRASRSRRGGRAKGLRPSRAQGGRASGATRPAAAPPPLHLLPPALAGQAGMQGHPSSI